MQWSALSAGFDGGTLAIPAQPTHKASIQSPIHTDKPPCVPGGFPNCVGHDTFDGTISLHCMLCVTDVSFRQLKDPTTGDDTLTDVPDSGTYDGNRVEIDATVTNVGPIPISTPVYFLDGDTHHPLVPDDLSGGWNPLQPVTFPAGTTTHVTFEWNTTGSSWRKAQPHPTQRVDVLTPLGGAYRDITVLPKPVVLVHGWNSDATTWATMKSLLRAQNPDWRGYAVGDNPTWSAAMNTDKIDGVSISQNAFTMAKYIESLRAHLGAQHVDLVAHSMGGLISRYYIANLMPKVTQPPGNRPVVAHLIMLGTPNLGSPCAVPLSVAAGQFGNAIPTYQLRPDYIADVFDKTVTDQQGVPFSVEAGVGYSMACEPFLTIASDTVVTLQSAWWNYVDVDKIRDMHTSLPRDPNIVTNFIKPRLAVGLPDFAGGAATHPAVQGVPPTTRPAAAKGATNVDNQLAAASDTTLASHRSHSVPVAVPRHTSRLDAVFTAPDAVAATLISPSGKHVATQTADSSGAGGPMRALGVSKPAAGRWTLLLRNTGSAPAPVLVGAALTGGTVALRATAIRAARSGRIVITAKLLQGRTALRGVTATARLQGASDQRQELRLYDDGKHHDGASGDGVYGAQSPRLPAGPYFVNVRASRRSTLRLTSVFSP